MCVATPQTATLWRRRSRAPLLSNFGEIFTCGLVGHGRTSGHLPRRAPLSANAEIKTWVFEDALYAVRHRQGAGFHVVGVFDHSEGRTAKYAPWAICISGLLKKWRASELPQALHFPVAFFNKQHDHHTQRACGQMGSFEGDKWKFTKKTA